MMRSAKGRLPRLIEGAARLSGPSALSKKQARQMVALFSPWKSRPAMSETQARGLVSQATGVLNSSQLAALEAGRVGRGPRGTGGPPDGNRRPRDPERRPPPDGGRMGDMRAMMATFNPLFAGARGMESQLPERMREGMQRRRERLGAAFSQLQQMAR